MTKFPSYAVGTVSIDAGATVVTGAGGPLWTSTTNVRPGDDLVVAGHIVIIEDVIDDGHLEIDAWSFPAVPAGMPYKIVQRSPLRFSGAEASADVIKLVGALNTEGLPFIVPPGVAAPDPSLGEENQFGIQPSTFKLWLKTGGAWVFEGLYKGLRVRGEWNAVDTFEPNDVVSHGGSSYVGVVESTNQEPPNETFWSALALKGDAGDKGDVGPTGAGYGGTSTTLLTLAAGVQTFETQPGLAYRAGARVRLSSGSNYMEGVVTAYVDANMSVSIDKVFGAGTFANWNLNIAGQPGTPLGAQQRFQFGAAAAQTVFNGNDSNGALLSYTPGFLELVVNGLWIPPTDYAATDGASVTLSSASQAGDVVYMFALATFNPADAISKSQNGGDILDKAAFLNAVSGVSFSAAQTLSAVQQDRAQRNVGLPAALRSHLAGLTLSTPGASASFGVAAGVAADSTNSDFMALAAAITKTTAAWAAGSGNGALDAGALVNPSWYHVFLIKRPDTGVTDVLISLSPTAPTLPANYTIFRRIGSIATTASAQWQPFTQSGDEFLWVTPFGDVNVSNLGTAPTLFALAVPTGVKVNALIRGNVASATASTTLLINSPDEAATAVYTPVGNISAVNPAANIGGVFTLSVRTNASSQVRAVAGAANTTVVIATYGWIDRRGKDN